MNILVSKDGNCPFCKAQTSCPKCNSDVKDKIKTLCTPEKRVINWKFLFIKSKCTIPGYHFHLKCKQGSSICYGSHKNGKECYDDCGKRWNIILQGCGGEWIQPIKETLKTINTEQLMKETKFKDLLT